MGRFNYQRAYRRNLPHFQPPGANFFVTFRLTGSLPQHVVRQWRLERQWLEQLAQTNVAHYEQVKGEFERVWFMKFESLLDGAATGPVWLKDERVASSVAESLHYRHGKAYRLDAFTIMPNHVHTVIKPLPIDQGERLDLQTVNVKNDQQVDEIECQSLSAVMQSLKGYTAFKGQSDSGSRGRILGA
jgi:hypothetical protein